MNITVREAKVLGKNIKYPIPKESKYDVKGLDRTYAMVKLAAKAFGKFAWDDTLETAVEKVTPKEIGDMRAKVAAAMAEFKDKLPALEHLARASSNRSFVFELLGIVPKARRGNDLSLEIADRSDVITMFLEKADTFISAVEKFMYGSTMVNRLKASSDACAKGKVNGRE